MSDESRFDAGMRVRRAVLGDAHVDRAEAAATAFDAPFQKFITETAWGTLWADDTLDHRTRSLITIALLAALGRHEELALHLRATANTGATPEEIRAALMHVAMYAGVPAANSAFTLAKTILDTQSRGQLRGQSWGQTPRAQPEGSDPLDRGQTPSGSDPLATHGDSA